MSDTKPAAPAAPPAPSKSKKLVVIGLGAFLIVAGGGGGFWWWTRGAKAEANSAHEKKEAAEAGGGIVPLEPFLVNLADTDGSRFLRTSLKLVVADEQAAERLTKNEVIVTRARSAILELLTTQTSDELVTAGGKAALKKAICERVSPLTGGTQVTDVLFSDFVVQF